MAELQRWEDTVGRLEWCLHMVDGIHLQAHRHAAGASGADTQSARLEPRRGFGSKINLRCERQGRPSTFALIPGEQREQNALVDLMHVWAVKRARPDRPQLQPTALLDDCGYTGEPDRSHLCRRGITAVVPKLTTERRTGFINWCLYRKRDVDKRIAGQLMGHRHNASRYDKRRTSYVAIFHLREVRLWLRKRALQREVLRTGPVALRHLRG